MVREGVGGGGARGREGVERGDWGRDGERGWRERMERGVGGDGEMSRGDRGREGEIKIGEREQRKKKKGGERDMEESRKSRITFN